MSTRGLRLSATVLAIEHQLPSKTGDDSSVAGALPECFSGAHTAVSQRLTLPGSNRRLTLDAAVVTAVRAFTANGMGTCDGILQHDLLWSPILCVGSTQIQSRRDA